MKVLYGQVKSILSFYGLFGLPRGLYEHWASWSLDGRQHAKTSGPISSASDNSSFLGICALAVKEDSYFNTFRRNKNFRAILEHVSKRRGKSYLKETSISDIGPRFGPFLEKQSELGAPFKYKYKKLGSVSPTSLRYLKVYSDLIRLFGSLDQFKVGEIGVGFGGQASLILNFSNVTEYHLFDLPEVLKLNLKFLSKLGLEKKCFFHDGRNPDSLNPDLLISNYAFSELIRPVQEMYLEKVIYNSSKGYLTWNDIALKKYGSYSLEELLSAIPGSVALEEVPLTAPGNVIVVWGHIT